MDLLKAYALSFIGRPYYYGGDDPIGGFDCSGLVGELLMSAGVIPHSHTKMNAQQLFNRLEKDGSMNVWGLGAIVFFGASATAIGHVGFCLDNYRMVEAGGGDQATTTPGVAIVRNAFVKIRPIKYRKDFLCVIKPRYACIGVV